jgi:hypothetical protein
MFVNSHMLRLIPRRVTVSSSKDGVRYNCLHIQCDITGKGLWEIGNLPSYPHARHERIWREQRYRATDL